MNNANRFSLFRFIRRMGWFALFTMTLLPLHLVWSFPLVLLRRLPRRQNMFVRLWFRSLLWAFGVRVTIVNKKSLSKKQKFFLCNHISYLDILVLGAYFDCFFVAKSDIASWPVFGFLARSSGTLFIVRERRFIKEQLTLLKKHLSAKQSLMIFPEGTTGNGREILPFKSSLLNAVLEMKKKPVIQPLSLIYTKLNDNKLETPEDFDQIAWYGDMTFGGHFKNLIGQKTIHARVMIHPSFAAQPDSTPRSLSNQAFEEIKSSF